MKWLFNGCFWWEVILKKFRIIQGYTEDRQSNEGLNGFHEDRKKEIPGWQELFGNSHESKSRGQWQNNGKVL